MKHLLVLLLLVYSSVGLAQNIQKKIDSLLVLAETATDSTRLSILNKVGFHYVFSDLPKAKSYLKKGLTEASSKNNTYWQAAIHNTYGIYMDISGKSDSARFYFREALQIAQKNNISSIVANATNNLGMYHWNQKEYDDALSYFFEGLTLDTSGGKRKSLAASYSNIGLIYQEMGQYDKALKHHEIALQFRRENKIENEIPISLNNMAIIFKEKGAYDYALQLIEEALSISQQLEVKREYVMALNTKGNIYILTGKTEASIPFFEEAIAEREMSNIDRKANIENISSLIYVYNKSNNTKVALQYVESGKDLLEEFPEIRNNYSKFYEHTAETYFRNGNYENGSAYLELAMKLKDSLFSKENAQSLATLETKYKTAEKEKALAETKANLIEKEVEVQKKNTWIIGGFGLAFLLGCIGYLLNRQQRLKNKQLEKEGALKTALARIETQNKLQEQRLRISRDLHDNIGSQLTFIISSIDNLAFGLKEKESLLTEKLATIGSFTTTTIYELRDTIWAMNKNKISLEDLQSRIANYIDQANFASSETLFEFTVSKMIARDCTFTSIQGMNVYRVIQEAINNAIKYAKATKISVMFDVTKASLLLVQIKDDGVGFNPETTPNNNGIANMEKRAKELGGSIVITSNEKGTIVLLKTNISLK